VHINLGLRQQEVGRATLVQRHEGSHDSRRPLLGLRHQSPQLRCWTPRNQDGLWRWTRPYQRGWINPSHNFLGRSNRQERHPAADGCIWWRSSLPEWEGWPAELHRRHQTSGRLSLWIGKHLIWECQKIIPFSMYNPYF